MAEFIDFQTEDENGNSDIKSYRNDDEVSLNSFIDYSFQDNNPSDYDESDNVTRSMDRALEGTFPNRI